MLLELLSQGEVQAAVSVQEAKLPSRNLVAELPGGQGEVVVLGAHYDTVADTQGANDNTSGLAVLLILAEELASRDLPFRVRSSPSVPRKWPVRQPAYVTPSAMSSLTKLLLCSTTTHSERRFHRPRGFR